MLILIVPILLLLLLIVGIVLLLFKRWIVGTICLLGALGLNLYTQTVPFNLRFSTDDKVEDSYRILTYNIGLNNHYLAEHKNDLSQIAAFLNVQDADIVVLPESRLMRTPEFKTVLDQQYQYCITQSYEIDPRYIETFVYSHYPIMNVQSVGHYIYAMDIVLPHDTLLLLACHLTSNQSNSSLTKGKGLYENLQQGFNNRVQQADSINNFLSDYRKSVSYTHPIIICGDLNDLSGSRTINSLQQNKQLKDAWWQGGFGYGATFTGKNLYFRLDHILFTEQQIELQNIYVPDVEFSDHLPLIADFKLR